jgi:hypothetical protein
MHTGCDLFGLTRTVCTHTVLVSLLEVLYVPFFNDIPVGMMFIVTTAMILATLTSNLTSPS